jgi:hypothetical protein
VRRERRRKMLEESKKDKERVEKVEEGKED